MVEDLAEQGEDYDWILLDCPPSLGVLTVAALTAAEGVLIPLQCETLSHRGVGQLLDTVHDVRRFTNRDLTVWGVLPTLYDGRTNHARAVLDTISDTYDLEVHRAPDPEDHQVRRGAGCRPVDPGHQPQQQGRPGLPRGGRQPLRPGGVLIHEPATEPHRRAATPRRRPAPARRERSAALRPARRARCLGERHRHRDAGRQSACSRRWPAATAAATATPRTTRPPPRARSWPAPRPRRPPTPPRNRRPSRTSRAAVPAARARTSPRSPPRATDPRTMPPPVTPATRTRRSPTTPVTAGGSSSTRATSGCGWSTTTRTSSGPTSSRAASTTTSTPAPTRSTRGPSRRGASTTPGR